MLINDNLNKTQYALKLDGKIMYKNSQLALVENFRETLPIDVKERANIVPVTSDNKEILFG